MALISTPSRGTSRKRKPAADASGQKCVFSARQARFCRKRGETPHLNPLSLQQGESGGERNIDVERVPTERTRKHRRARISIASRSFKISGHETNNYTFCRCYVRRKFGAR